MVQAATGKKMETGTLKWSQAANGDGQVGIMDLTELASAFALCVLQGWTFRMNQTVKATMGGLSFFNPIQMGISKGYRTGSTRPGCH